MPVDDDDLRTLGILESLEETDLFAWPPWGFLFIIDDLLCLFSNSLGSWETSLVTSEIMIKNWCRKLILNGNLKLTMNTLVLIFKIEVDIEVGTYTDYLELLLS